MALPALLGLLLFIALPFLFAVVLSFTSLKMGSPLPTRFVGAEQYHRVLTAPSFQRALLNNALFALAVVPLQTASALGLALLLNIRLRGIAVFRTLFFMPVVFPMSLVAVIWTLIYAPGPGGMMNSLMALVSGGNLGPWDYLHTKVLALPAIIVMSVWQGVGFQMVVLLGGLQSIPAVLYEAAVIDRAGKWGCFCHVTLPRLRNHLIFTALVTTILAFRLFDQVRIMTRGGPDNATTTVMFEAVRAVFERQQVGAASAMTVIFFLIVLGITRLQRMLVREEREIS
ncbi:sugar ABC transporter permease [Desulfonema ishimotonii]|uniref:Sugar ABC transporter permease n=2 Tax=Desulfonema ishimotonii TaxID=45657 RepID=A0A401FV03_9BACT|nr:sugar ABC transporter permease [Desulfonema ishimotonii]